MDPALHVRDVAVFEAAHHLDDGVRLPDVAEEGVAEALALAGPPDQSGNIHKFLSRREDSLGSHDPCEHRQPGVGDVHHARIRLDGAEGIVRRGRAGAGKGVEKGGLSYIGQTHDATGDSHSILQAFQYLRDQM